MKHKVIFDTNKMRSHQSLNNFLGNREEVKKFSQISEIIIPEMVIDEIIKQKRNHLISKKNAFLENPFLSLANIPEEKIKSFDIDNRISEILENEEILYTKISLTKETALEDIKELCRKNSPPFVENGDKGFKDAHIYLTVLEYLNTLGREVIYFVTEDKELKKSFNQKWQVEVILNYDEFIKKSGEFLKGEYFIGELKNEFGVSIEKKHIERIWINLEQNWVLKINFDDEILFVEVDLNAKEILNSKLDDYSNFLAKLISSELFRDTYKNVSLLEKYQNFFDYDDVYELIKASTENNQIYWLVNNYSIKNFFVSLYQKGEFLFSNDIELKENFKKKFGI